MRNTSSQPHTCINPVRSNNCSREPYATLHHDPRLLRINRYWAILSCGFDVTIKGFAPHARFVFEVIRKPVVTTRVPNVGGHKTMSALRALPKRSLCLRILHFTSHY